MTAIRTSNLDLLYSYRIINDGVEVESGVVDDYQLTILESEFDDRVEQWLEFELMDGAIRYSDCISYYAMQQCLKDLGIDANPFTIEVVEFSELVEKAGFEIDWLPPQGCPIHPGDGLTFTIQPAEGGLDVI